VGRSVKSPVIDVCGAWQRVDRRVVVDAHGDFCEDRAVRILAESEDL
jgi:hypothetical protein